MEQANQSDGARPEKQANSAQCACGCGTQLAPDPRGRSKRFVSGHNARTGRRKTWPIFKCSGCGEPFELEPYRANSNVVRRYCSAECRDQHRKVFGVVARKPPQMKSCRHCGTDFIADRKRGILRRNYCSSECGAKAKSVKLRQKRAEYVIGQTAKDRAKQRDQNRCLVCGFDSFVHAHHIVERSKGGTDDLKNLVTLCPNHHAMAHGKMLSVEYLQTLIVEDQNG